MLPSFEILHKVANFYGISVDDLKGKTRTKDIVEARQSAAYLLRLLNELSFPAIGRVIGKDHTTIIHACDKISKKIDSKPAFKESLKQIIDSLKDVEDIGNVKNPISLTSDEINYLNKRLSQEEAPTESKAQYGFETSEEILKGNRNIEISDREVEILSKYRSGMTLEEIAGSLSITRERVRQLTMKALIKELGQKAKDGLNIDVKEYIDSQKAMHWQAYKLPEAKRKEVIDKIESGLTAREAMKEYGFDKKKFLSIFPQYEDKLIMELTQRKRWSRFYDRCRSCRTALIPHAALGYCGRCYTKTSEFKEIQKKSHEKNREKRKAKSQAYHREYVKRPEIIALMKKRWDDNNFGGNREAALERENFKCSKCGISRGEAVSKYGKDLFVRHQDGNLKNNELNNLVPQCSRCFFDASRRKNANRAS